MENNHEKCRVEQRGESLHVFIRPESVTESLNEKLSPEDITKAIDMVNDVMNLSNLNNSLYRQCNEVSCIAKSDNPFRAIPNGNQKAKIILLNKMPTQYESCRMFSHCDTDSIFLSLVLSRVNMTRNDIYCTDMIKCNCNNLDESSFRACIEHYLLKEIQYIQPKLIICNGIAVLKSWAKLGYIEGLPQDISYGNIYDVIIAGISLKITAIFDLERVLQKQGQELSECKGKLWIQILNAIRSIGGNNG